MTDKYYAAKKSNINSNQVFDNSAFYTTDGMRFEFGYENIDPMKLYESGVYACTDSAVIREKGSTYSIDNVFRGDHLSSWCYGCGSYGLDNNVDMTTYPPCIIMVDVNGDRKPNPQNVNCHSEDCMDDNIYKYADPLGKKLTDVFSIMITDKAAIPYGYAAQKAMYQAQK